MEVVEGRLAVLEARASRVESQLNGLWRSLDDRTADLAAKLETYERTIETYERVQGMLMERLDYLESQMQQSDDQGTASVVSDAEHGRSGGRTPGRCRLEELPPQPPPGS